MSAETTPAINLQQLHQEISRLSGEDIRALQATGIQQAARHGLRQDSRFFILMGVIVLVIGILNPIALIVRGVIVLIAIAMIVWGGKSYMRPSLPDMQIMSVLLGVSALVNLIGGIFSLLAFNQLQIAYAIVLIAMAAVEIRWLLNLRGAYAVAKTSDGDLQHTSEQVIELYFKLSRMLANTQSQPDNAIVHFGRGKGAMRMLLSHPYGIILQENGLLRVMLPDTLAMRPSEGENPKDLTFVADLALNQRIVHGTVSQISYQTFQTWQQRVL